MERTRVIVGGMECICRSSGCPLHGKIDHVVPNHTIHDMADIDHPHIDFAELDNNNTHHADEAIMPNLPSQTSRVDRIRGRASRRRNTSSFIPYIRRMVHSMPATQNLSISGQALQALNDLMSNVMDDISTKAGKMCSKVNRKTLLPKDMQAASKIALPTKLFEEANTKAYQALSKF